MGVSVFLTVPQQVSQAPDTSFTGSSKRILAGIAGSYTWHCPAIIDLHAKLQKGSKGPAMLWPPTQASPSEEEPKKETGGEASIIIGQLAWFKGPLCGAVVFSQAMREDSVGRADR